jgi:hypothetical protein
METERIIPPVKNCCMETERIIPQSKIAVWEPNALSPSQKLLYGNRKHLALFLFMFRIFGADNHYHTLAANDFTAITARFY